MTSGPSRGAARSSVIVLALATLGSLVAGEILLRALLFSRAHLLLAASLAHYVANPYAGDDFNRILLRLRLRGRERDPVFPAFDPLLGWTAKPRSPENPLGLAIREPYTIERLGDERTMLFLGDSFVAGLTAPEDAIPQRLAEELPGWKVLNLGVPAYGLDQMYLQLESVVDHLGEAHVIVGIFYNDIDRIVHRVGPTPKPYFEVENGVLALRGTPIAADYGEWVEEFPPARQLYLTSAVGGLFRRLMVTAWAREHLFFLHPSETHAQRGTKEELTRLLVQAIQQSCRRRQVALTVVLFPYREHLVHDGWYARLMRRTLAEQQVDYVDLAEPLRQRVRDLGLDWTTGVYTLSDHPGAEENRFLAHQIGAFLRRTYGY